MEVKEHGKDTFNINWILNCNYDVNDYAVSSQFSNELDWRYMISNNKEIRIDNTPIYEIYFKSGIIYTYDLPFRFNITDSYSQLNRKVNKTNFFFTMGRSSSLYTF